MNYFGIFCLFDRPPKSMFFYLVLLFSLVLFSTIRLRETPFTSYSLPHSSYILFCFVSRVLSFRLIILFHIILPPLADVYYPININIFDSTLS